MLSFTKDYSWWKIVPENRLIHDVGDRIVMFLFLMFSAERNFYGFSMAEN